MKDYGVNFDHVPLLCDNESAIKIAHNPVLHSKTKHIEIHYHFIQEHVEKGISISLMFVLRINLHISFFNTITVGKICTVNFPLYKPQANKLQPVMGVKPERGKHWKIKGAQKLGKAINPLPKCGNLTLINSINM